MHGRGVALACALAAVLAAGCSSGDKPVALPSLSPSQTAAASPSPTSSATEIAAVSAVVRQYYALLNVTTSRQQANQLAALMTPSCHCRDVVKAIRAAVTKGQHFFGQNKVQSLVPNLDGPRAADVLLTYDFTRSGIKDASGRVVSSGPGMKGATQDFRLERQGDRWLISQILRVSSGTRQ
jgi:hypothetical protein